MYLGNISKHEKSDCILVNNLCKHFLVLKFGSFLDIFHRLKAETITDKSLKPQIIAYVEIIGDFNKYGVQGMKYEEIV